MYPLLSLRPYGSRDFEIGSYRGAITKLQLRDEWTFDTFRPNKSFHMLLNILYLAISVSIYQKVFELGLKIYSLCLFWFAVAKMMAVTERQDRNFIF